MVLLAINFDNLHQILQNLYTDMMPLCSQMTGVAKGLAGLGALFYVAYRIWQSLARAEPVDVFPLLRPFALGLCIMFFPTLVLGTLNSVMSPIVKGTHSILESQTFDMNEYRAQKDRLEFEAMKRNPETAYLVDKESFDNRLDELGVMDAIEACGMYVDRAMYNMKKAVQNFFRELLELMFNAAALVIDTLRTFFLIVLSILGPISFALSCWDGFQASLSQWFVRYISIYLWLPVSDLFSSVLARIQVLMLQQDIEQLFRPKLHTGRLEWRLHHFPDYRNHRVFHHPDRGQLDHPGRRRCRQLRQERDPDGIQNRFRSDRSRRCGGGQHRRKAHQVVIIILKRH